jgi:autotransporter-associated beta strand protein
MIHRLQYYAAIVLVAAAPPFARAADDVAGHFVDLKPNGGWSWFQDPRVIADNNQLIFGSVAGTTNAFANAGDVQVTSYNLSNATTAVSTLAPAFQSDDHDVPALLTLPDGRYMAIYEKHGSDNLARWRISTNPGSTAAWGAEQTGVANPLNDGNGNTYANPFYLSVSNQVYSFSRSVGYDTNYSVFTGVNTTNDSSPTYNYGGHFLVWNNPNNGVNGATGGNGRPYVKYASNGVDTIWFTNTEDSPDSYWNSIYGGYIKFNAAGAGTVYKSDGTVVGPLSTTSGTTQSYSPQAFTKIFDGTTNNGNNAASWTNSMQLDSAGNPYAVFSIRVNDPSDAFQANDLRYYYTHFNGSSWQTHFLAYAGSPLYSGQNNYAGLATVDPTNPNVVFISTNYTPDSDMALAHYEIYEGITSDGGNTWTWTAITSNSTVDNIRPIIPQWSGTGTRPLVWLRGTYTSYTNYNLDVVGTLPLPPGANYWNNSGGGDWDTAANWTVAAPNAAAAAAYFGNGVTPSTANSAITISGTKTVGALTFDDPTYSYSLVSGTNGALSLNNGVGTPATITVNRGSHSIAVPLALTSDGVIVSTGSSAMLTVSGNITGSGGLTKASTGTLMLSGASSYSGTTTVSGGILRADGSALSSSSNLTINGGQFASSVTRTVGSAAGQIQLTGGTSGFATAGSDVTVTIQNAGSAVVWGSSSFNPSTLLLTSTSSNSVNLATDINLNAASRTVQPDGGVSTISGVLSGATGSLQVVGGSGILALANTNTYGGGTTIGTTGGGVIRAAAAGAVGTGTVVIAANGNASTGRLELQGGIALANTVSFNGRNNDTVAIENISGTNSLTGQISLGVGGTRYWVQSDSGLLTLSGGLTSAASSTRNLTLRGAGDGIATGSITNGSATFSITKEDAGTWTLSAGNSYSGGTAVNAGTLVVGHANGLGTGALTINNTATAKLTAGVSAPVQLPGLTIAGGTSPTATLDVTNNNLVIHNGNVTTTLAQLRSGLNSSGALWTGAGITSSTAAANGAANSNATVFAVGAIKNIDKNNAFIYSTWPAPPSPDPGATGLTTTDVLVKYTYFGDADLNGVVDNTTDYDLWSNGFTNAGLAATNGWLYGDFDFSGIVDNTTDYDLWSTGFAHQGSALSSSTAVDSSVHPVPEPTSLLAAVVGSLMLLARGLITRRA